VMLHGECSYRHPARERARSAYEMRTAKPPSIPFWLGEVAPAHRRGCLASVSRLRLDLEARLDEVTRGGDAVARGAGGYRNPGRRCSW